MRDLVEPHLKDLVPYVPGKPIEETEREYGISDIAKLASNENCLGPSPRAIEAVRQASSGMHLYPDAGAFYLKQRLVSFHAAHDVTADQLVVGNGTNELLVLMARAFLGQGEALLNAWPSFVVYRLAARGCGREEIAVPLDDSRAYDLEAMAKKAQEPGSPVKLVVVANPNNPTGRHRSHADLAAFADALPSDVLLVIDEAYAEYATADDYADGLAIAQKRPRTVLTRTFSKAYGLAALRVGYAVCDPDIADMLNRLRDPFNANQLGQVGALAALDDTDHVARSRVHNAEEMPKVQAGLEALGVEVTPSQANFVLATFDERMPALGDLNEALLRRGVIVRPVAGYGLPRSARISIGTAAENERLLGALEEVLQGAS